VRTQIYQWIKTNSVMLVNAGSLIGTTVVTGVLGLAFWWVAARQFPPQAVGLASAAISVMLLLGAICILGLGTLLIGELPRQPGKEGSLISAALILVGGVGLCGGIVFAFVAPLVSADFQPFRANIGGILLFAMGVSLTTVTIVLDQALIGLLKGGLQFWRNSLFAAVKLVVLILAGFWLLKVGETIYGAWTIGIVLSLVPLAGLAVLKGDRSRRAFMPDWELLRKLGLPALQHHLLNLILQAPTTALPVLVTILLSATTNAWFYMAWMISGLVFIASYALTTVLYAVNSAQQFELTRKIRMTLGLALIMSILGNLVIQFGATQILNLFGHVYAEQAAWSLRILGFGAFPMIIKQHYVAIGRIRGKMASVSLPVAIGSLLELGIAALGAHLGGLVGLSLGWVIAVCIEAIFMFPAVYRAAFPVHESAWEQVKQILPTGYDKIHVENERV
jgi:O-antigen/teichoic acid export membrane protein